MNILTGIYVFLLYILCSPGLLFKSYNYLHAFVMSIILYLTFDIVNQTRENLIDNKVEINRQGVKDLVGNLEQEIHDGILNIDVNREINYSPAEDNTGIAAICKKKVQDIQKYKEQIEKLKSEIVVDDEMENEIKTLRNLITKLNAQEINLFKQINSLDNTILSKETIISKKDDMIYSLNNTVSDLSGTRFTLNANLNEQNNKLQNKKETIQLKTETISNLDLEVNNKDQVIQNKTNQLANFTDRLTNFKNKVGNEIQLSGGGDDNLELANGTINEKNNKIQQLNNEINNLKTTIQDKTTEIQDTTDAIQDKTNAIQDKTNAIQDKTNAIQDTTNAIQLKTTDLQNNNARIYEMTTAYNGQNTKISELQTTLNRERNTIAEPDKNSCSTWWLAKMQEKCPSNRQCFTTYHSQLGNFVNDFEGQGTSFEFNRIYNSDRNNGSYWSKWTVANSWTNSNPFVRAGKNTVPMKYVKISV
jgi:DNA repair exonuclease SbcCD ATPase subunit